MSLLSRIQAAGVKWEYKLFHIGQDEPSTMVLVKRGSLNALVDGPVLTSFGYTEEDVDGGALPDGVNYELRVDEELLTEDDLKGITGIRHGSKLFRVVQPSPFYPSNKSRIYRFWLAAVEKL